MPGHHGHTPTHFDGSRDPDVRRAGAADSRSAQQDAQPTRLREVVKHGLLTEAYPAEAVHVLHMQAAPRQREPPGQV